MKITVFDVTGNVVGLYVFPFNDHLNSMEVNLSFLELQVAREPLTREDGRVTTLTVWLPVFHSLDRFQ